VTGAELRTRRRALGLNQRALARLLGVHEQTVRAWEAARIERSGNARTVPAYVELALVALEAAR
jgi:DNA-binding transcriptional regulator YiaG